MRTISIRSAAIPARDIYSPLIPFYWWFREESEKINRQEWHGEWLDRHGNRLDKNGAKGGGPFVNATTNLPDCWDAGVSAGTAAFLDTLGKDPTRPVREAPERRYFVLAALRLAALIEIIRTRPATREAAINIMGHSQGCLVSLLAQAIIAEQRRCRPADTLILQAAGAAARNG